MPANAQQRPADLEGVDVIERLGEYVDLELPFVDENGKDVQLKDYFGDDKTVILTLNYYNCPMLCSMQLNAMIAGLQELEWAPGDNYRIVTISIDPREGPDLAAAKREVYLEELGQGMDVEWAFLTGDEANIRAVAEQVGFGYRYVREIDEYAHTATIFVLSRGAHFALPVWPAVSSIRPSDGDLRGSRGKNRYNDGPNPPKLLPL